ncbi:NAD(P)/FAD-dependent oxidoreductase [Rhizobium glycinendophyticum]|uniref:FAD-binding oxidoreductase n=1 Tax=Rhizobium glycinendophyticum TaxID=2589807 RepID=A0A504UBA6_9HYPH|nr:FAD-dependent oxidoreductase [Rhizobium glycinendophyticum]TPP11769.1 FAD-binding oxidoreductase [Rhizobium glycinendophyticum]
MSDKSPARAGQSFADVVIVGGGIMGLWAALEADRAGLSTLLLDAGPLAAGASGGLLGALMPHMPDKWNEKKQLQFEALLSLEREIAALEAETGLSAGYRRAGRLIPLPKPHLRKIAERHQAESEANWNQNGVSFSWNVIDQSPHGALWPTSEVTAAGLVFDTFAARVSPRGLTGLLVARLKRSSRVKIDEGVTVTAIDVAASVAQLSDGRFVSFGHLIVAAGHASFPLLSALGPVLARPLGQPVKGQAALLSAPMIAPYLPLLYLDGLYIVPHEGGRVAIGSTSEDRFNDPFTTDQQLGDVLARAVRLAPQLAEADVIERWAGLRPKAIDRDPMVGPHPAAERVIALTGGFKVSFGLAHVLARAALAPILGLEAAVPESFSTAHHLSVAARMD